MYTSVSGSRRDGSHVGDEMQIVDIMLDTTWTASTSIIPLPDGYADIAFVPTTQYLIGTDAIQEVNVLRNDDDGVQINYQGVKYNVLRLRYRAVGELCRT